MISSPHIWQIIPEAGMPTIFTTYDNSHIKTPQQKSWRFEYNPMVDINDRFIRHLYAKECVGIFSWKFQQKTGYTRQTLLDKFIRMGEVDVYNLSPNLGSNIGGCGCFMDWSVDGHGERLRELIKACCEEVGINYCNAPRDVIYANLFIAKASIYRDYMERVIKPSLELLEGPLWEKVNVPAGYTAGLQETKLYQSTGLRFYNYLPFVLERMMMQYVNHYKLSIQSML